MLILLLLYIVRYNCNIYVIYDIIIIYKYQYYNIYSLYVIEYNNIYWYNIYFIYIHRNRYRNIYKRYKYINFYYIIYRYTKNHCLGGDYQTLVKRKTEILWFNRCRVSAWEEEKYSRNRLCDGYKAM